MKKNISLAFSIILFNIFLCSPFIAANAQYQQGGQSGGQEQVGSDDVIESRIKPTIVREGLKFKDLNNNGLLDVYEDWRQPVEKRVNNLISLMTVEELVGQVYYNMIRTSIDGGASAIEQARQQIMEDKMSAIVNDGSAHPSVVAAFSNTIQEIAEGSRLGIPITFHSHAGLGGPGIQWTVFPGPMGIGATNDLDLVEKWGEVIAKEYRAMGLHVRVYPMIDVATEPRWSRIRDLFSEDANKVADIALAYLKGSTSEDSTLSIISEFKHFPGGGAAPQGKDPHDEEGSVYTFPGNNFDYHLIPWKAVIDAGARRIMPYYYINNKYNPNFAQSFSKEVLDDLLRKELGFEGIISSDWRAVADRAYGLNESISQKERYMLSMKAGMDNFAIAVEPAMITELINEGKLSIERVKETAAKHLEDKINLGLFENPYVDTQKAAEICRSEEHLAISERAHRESIVMLTNNNLLPFEEGKVDEQTGKVRRLNLFVYNIDTKEAGNYGNIVDDPEEADVIVLKIDLFEGDYSGGPSLEFPEESKAMIDVLKETGVPVILAINFSRPGVVPKTVIDSVDALFAMFGSSDSALLDLILGRFNPSGKLPVQIPSTIESVEKQVEDVPFDLENPSFDFGFGLSYE